MDKKIPQTTQNFGSHKNLQSWGIVVLSVQTIDAISCHSYWTDNGACYYYTTVNFSNYEEALIAVKEQADKDGIPYRYVQVTFKIHQLFWLYSEAS